MIKRSRDSMHRARDPLPLADVAFPRDRHMSRPTVENPLIISPSELRDWTRCRLKWWWRDQCQLESRVKPQPLTVGGAGHQIMERFYKLPPLKRTPKRIVKIAQKIVGAQDVGLEDENRELLVAMTGGYAAWAKAQDEEIGLVQCEAERAFDLPLVPDGSLRLRGRIDVSFKPVTLKRTIAYREFKFLSQIRSRAMDLNMQISAYLWALKQLHPKCTSYLGYYTVLRKQMPGPRVKADLFMTEEIERTDAQLEQWRIDVVRMCMSMLDAFIYPQALESCDYDCDFMVPCSLRGDDEDVLNALHTGFKPREYRT